MVDEKILEARRKLQQKFEDNPNYVINEKDALILVCDSMEKVEVIYKYEKLKKGIEEKSLTKEEVYDFFANGQFEDREFSRFLCLNYII